MDERKPNTDPEKFRKGYDKKDYAHAKAQPNRDWTKEEEKDINTRQAEYLLRLEKIKTKTKLGLETVDKLKNVGTSYTFIKGDTLYPVLKNFYKMNEHTAFFVMTRMLQEGINVDLISPGDSLTINTELISNFGRLTFVHKDKETGIESILNPAGKLPAPDMSKVYSAGEAAPAGAAKAPAKIKTPAGGAKKADKKEEATVEKKTEASTEEKSDFDKAMDKFGIGKALREKFEAVTEADTESSTGYVYLRTVDDKIIISELDAKKPDFALLLTGIEASLDKRFKDDPVENFVGADTILNFNKQTKPNKVDKTIDTTRQKTSSEMYELGATASALQKSPLLPSLDIGSSTDNYSFIDKRGSDETAYHIELLKGKKISIHEKEKGTLIANIDLTNPDQANVDFVLAKIDAPEKKRQEVEKKLQEAQAKAARIVAERTAKQEEKERLAREKADRIAAARAEKEAARARVANEKAEAAQAREAAATEKRAAAAEAKEAARKTAEELRQAENTRIQETFQARVKELAEAAKKSNVHFAVDETNLTISWNGDKLAKVIIDAKDPSKDFSVEGAIKGTFTTPREIFVKLLEDVVFDKSTKEIRQALRKVPAIQAGRIENGDSYRALEIKRPNGIVIAKVTLYFQMDDEPDITFTLPTLDGSEKWEDTARPLVYANVPELESKLKNFFPTPKDRLKTRKAEVAHIKNDEKFKDYTFVDTLNGDFVDFAVTETTTEGEASVGIIKIWKNNPTFMIVTDNARNAQGTFFSVDSVKAKLLELPKSRVIGGTVTLGEAAAK